MGFVVAAFHSKVTRADAPDVVAFGAVFLIAGIAAIACPGLFRNYPVNPKQAPRPVTPGHDILTRFLGVPFCIIGVFVLILGIAKLV